MSNFSRQYPDFASIEHHVRQAHAERSVYIATVVADTIVGLAGALGRLIAGKSAQRSGKGALVVKASVPRETARV